MMKHHFVKSGAIDISVYTWGVAPTAADPREIIVLAHGFPDRAIFWKDVAETLQEQYFVVAFDMRGCGDSTPIKGRRHYRYAEIVKDLYAVIDDISGGQKIHLVGHDWGGLYGWEAIVDPEGEKRIASFTTQSPSLEQVGYFLRKRMLCPTPKNIFQMVGQLMRNALMMFFTLPLLPELVWRSGLGVALSRRAISHYEPGAVYHQHDGVENDAIRYLGIYRANLFQRTLFPKKRVSRVPVHAALSTRDPFLPPTLFDDCANWTEAYSYAHIDAAHWAPLSRPEELAKEIIKHIEKNRAIQR